MKYDQMTQSGLEKAYIDAKAELDRRKKINDIVVEVKAVFKKHRVRVSDDLIQKLIVDSDRSTKATVSRKKVKTQRTVAPKFSSVDGQQLWSGRGKTPNWVKQICDEEGLTIEEFKNHDNFKYTSK